MLKRIISILMTLILLYYQMVGMRVVFSQLTLLYATGSREYFLILAGVSLSSIALTSACLWLFHKEKCYLKVEWKVFLYLFLAFLAYLVMDFLMQLFIPVTSNQSGLNSLLEMTGKTILPYYLLNICLVGPIMEELLYRGVLMRTCSFISKWAGDIVLSSVIFGYVHVRSQITPLAFFFYAGVGLLLAGLYKKTNSLFYPILLHILINTYASWDIVLSLFS